MAAGPHHCCDHPRGSRADEPGARTDAVITRPGWLSVRQAEVPSLNGVLNIVDVGSRFEIESLGRERVLLYVRPGPDPAQRIVSERLELGGAEAEEYETLTGRLTRLIVPPGRRTITYSARVEVRRPLGIPASAAPRLGDIHPAYLGEVLPSRYCPSDLIGPTALGLFGDGDRGALPERVANWVRYNLRYLPGVSDTLTAADETLLARAGVCRDFAHLTIAFLRALEIPARAVAAYAPGVDPPDLHAVVEADDGTGWRILDPTGMADPATLVRIATGRDAAEIAWATASGEVAIGPPVVWARLVDTDGLGPVHLGEPQG